MQQNNAYFRRFWVKEPRHSETVSDRMWYLYRSAHRHISLLSLTIMRIRRQLYSPMLLPRLPTVSRKRWTLTGRFPASARGLHAVLHFSQNKPARRPLRLPGEWAL